MKKIVYAVLVYAFIAVSCSSVQQNKPSENQVLVRDLNSFESRSGLPLADKIQSVPSFVLSYLQELDGDYTYSAYVPMKADLDLVRSYSAQMPESLRKISEQRLIGIFFVKNFKGGGMTDLTFDKNGNAFPFLILNPQILTSDMSKWITYRDNSSFMDDNKGYTLEIDCGKQYKALMHTLIHESVHVFDLDHNLSPQLMPGMNKGAKTGSLLTENVWKKYYEPVKKYNFTMRKEITAYGLSQPSIPLSKAVQLYKNLEKTPFLSLYGALSWAEDVAEVYTWYYLTEILHQKYEIKINKNSETVFVWNPAGSVSAKNRFSKLKKIPGLLIQ